MEREYPHLLFRRNWTLTSKAEFLLGQCVALVESMKNTPIMPQTYEDLMTISLIKGAQATTAIEGNTLTDEEVKNVLEGAKMPPSKEYQEIEVRNILDAYNAILREVIESNSSNLIALDLLRRFHEMVGKGLGEHFSAIPGRIRENNVTVGGYRCPDYKDVPELLEQLCSWLKEEFKFENGKQLFREVIIQAIVTHIYIEWIHPFGDGNGRVGRLVEFYILLRGGSPDITSHILSNYYNETRSNYYRQIENATSQRDLTAFIEYALLGLHDGLFLTLKNIQTSQRSIFWQKLIYDKFHDVAISNKEVFKRQRTLALELPTESTFSLIDIPELTIKLARLYSKMSTRTIARDIDKLLELGLVLKINGKYKANVSLINRMTAKKKGDF